MSMSSDCYFVIGNDVREVSYFALRVQRYGIFINPARVF